jgi:Tfp pilus assembly protein PilO
MAASGLDALTKIPMSRKVALLALLVILLGGGYYLLFYTEKVDKLAKQKDEMSAVQSAVDKAVRDYHEYETLTRDLETARGEVEQLNKVLPVDRDIEGLMGALSTQAKAARLRLTNIVPGDELEGEEGYYVKLPIKIEFRGTFHQVFHFFHLVDSTVERLVNLENIQMEIDTSAEEPNILKGTVIATTFMAKEPGSDEQATGSAPPR